MSFNYRLMQDDGYTKIIEVYYDEQNRITGWFIPTIVGNDAEDLRKAFDAPVLRVVEIEKHDLKE